MLVPLAEIVIVLVWTLGLMGVFGVPVTLVTTILPASGIAHTVPDTFDVLVVVGEAGADPLTLGMVAPDNETLLSELREVLNRRPLHAGQLNAYEVRQALARSHGSASVGTGLRAQLSSGHRIECDPEQPASKLIDDLLSVGMVGTTPSVRLWIDCIINRFGEIVGLND